MQNDLSVMVESLTRLAAQYGPFLFAILFTFVVTSTAHKYYRESNTRQPPASEEEKGTYRSYFRTSVWVGVALTLVSIGWWFYVQMFGPSTYQIAIVRLQPDEKIVSQYFAKTVPEPNIPGTVPLYDAYFIVTQDVPFKVGDKFDFYYYKAPVTPNQTAVATAGSAVGVGVGVTATLIEVKYSGNKLDTYQVTSSGSTVTLTTVANNATATVLASISNEISIARPQLASAAVTSSARTSQ